MSVIVETQDLSKTYMQGKVRVEVLYGIDLQLCEGEFIAILGPSGSGKSTLMNLLGALDRPTAGSIIIDGVNIGNLSRNQMAELRQKIGFVFQNFNLIPRLTALQNVLLVLKIGGQIPVKEWKQKAIHYLEMVGLGKCVNHRPAELSGGEQQRVAIARALVKLPRLLLMDEPTGNVDTKTRDMIMDLAIALNEKECVTTVVITHDPAVAERAERVIHLVDGRLQADGGE